MWGVTKTQWGPTYLQLITRSRTVFIFFPVKRKDTREHFGFENDHGLNFASRAVFWEMITGKKKLHGWNFWKWSRALFTGNSRFLDLITGRKKVSRATFHRNDSQPEWRVDVCVCVYSWGERVPALVQSRNRQKLKRHRRIVKGSTHPGDKKLS